MTVTTSAATTNETKQAQAVATMNDIGNSETPNKSAMKPKTPTTVFGIGNQKMTAAMRMVNENTVAGALMLMKMTVVRINVRSNTVRRSTIETMKIEKSAGHEVAMAEHVTISILRMDRTTIGRSGGAMIANEIEIENVIETMDVIVMIEEIDITGPMKEVSEKCSNSHKK